MQSDQKKDALKNTTRISMNECSHAKRMTTMRPYNVGREVGRGEGNEKIEGRFE